jgi:hypothetical protein
MAIIFANAFALHQWYGASGRCPSKPSSSACSPSIARIGMKRSGMCLRIQRCSAVPW